MKEKIAIWWLLRRLAVRRWWTDKLPRELAWMLPERIVYWALIRGIVKAAGPDRDPSSLKSYEIMEWAHPDYERLEAARERGGGA